jgi:trimeric autotransporter adhesin
MHSQIGGVSMVRGASLSVERNNRIIQPGSFDSLGTMVQNVPMNFVYTLRNEGANTLNLTNANIINVVSPFNADVSVVNMPPSTSIDGGGAAQVGVQVTARGPGPVLFAIEITSTDTLKSPYVFTVTGTGLAPRLALQRTLGDTIIAGGTDNIGNRPANVANTLTYYILNQGSATLQLQGNPPVSVVSADNVDVEILQQPTSSLLAPSGFQSFAIRIVPQLGTFNFELVIPNNDTNAPEYRVNVQGNGSTTSSLTLRDADGGAIVPHTSVYTTRNLAPGNTREITYLVENTGNANLELIGSPVVQIFSQNNVSAEVTQQPLQNNLSPGNFTPMIVSITPNAIGAFNAEVRILSNDAAVPSYLFTIAGFSARSSSSSDDGGCSAGSSSTGYTWVALLAILGALGVAARRTRRARTNG